MALLSAVPCLKVAATMSSWNVTSCRVVSNNCCSSTSDAPGGTAASMRLCRLSAREIVVEAKVELEDVEDTEADDTEEASSSEEL